MKSDEELYDRIEELAPWHHEVTLRPGIVTKGKRSTDHMDSRVSLIDPFDSFDNIFGPIFPDGMQGRSFLDCACNCGGYSFAAKDAGASKTYGFDVREHWINQAKFILENREADVSGITFEVADLRDLAQKTETFDVTLFKGIFYHLPDPVASLKLAADRTNEVIILDTACVAVDPADKEAPSLVFKMEGTEQLMSGVDGPSWLPSGPIVLKKLLHWLGFQEAKTYTWVQTGLPDKTASYRPPGRIAVAAARRPGTLENVRDVQKPTIR